MKKVIVLSAFALGLTLMSFNPKSEAAFELQEDGNYRIVNSNKISQDDIDFLISGTQEIVGAKKRKKVSFIKKDVAVQQISEVVTADESNTDVEIEIQLARVDQIISKYMD